MTLVATAILLSALHQNQATEPLVCSVVVKAPVAKVWEAYTTSKGIESWMVSTGTVDLKIGGKYRTSYQKKSPLTGDDVIENTILAFDPLHMVTIQNTRAPKKFPFTKALQELWTVIYFESVDSAHTKVTCRMNGFSTEPDSQKCKGFFRSGNQEELDWLVKKFANK